MKQQLTLLATESPPPKRSTSQSSQWESLTPRRPLFAPAVAARPEKARNGTQAKPASLVVDDDWPLATKDFIHLDKECLLSFLDQAEPGPGCCTLMHAFCSKRPLLCNDLTGKTEAAQLLFKFWHTNRSLRSYPHRMDEDLGPVVF